MSELVVSEGKFDIGSKVWPGLGKVLEESGELSQILAKIIATGGSLWYFDGSNLGDKLRDEVADLYAALDFFCEFNPIALNPEGAGYGVEERRTDKRAKFRGWQLGIRGPVA